MLSKLKRGLCMALTLCLLLCAMPVQAETTRSPSPTAELTAAPSATPDPSAGPAETLNPPDRNCD